MQIDPNLTAKLSYVKKETVPVILYSRQTIADIRGCISENYGQIKYELPFINAVAVELSKEKLHSVSGHRMIQMISDDALVTKVGRSGPPKDGAGAARPGARTAGYDVQCPARQDRELDRCRGMGTGIAFIDTGIAPHYDLIYPENRIIAFRDFINGRSMPYDDDGHGTHVAGIAAGNGFCSGRYAGTAPCASLIGVKALDDKGNGTTSDILAALQWIIDNRRRYNIRVVNLSLGVPTDLSYGEDPLIKGANAAVACGLTVVAAAGNSGPGRGTINSPGTSPYVITVGAADAADASVADFSSRGPTSRGFLKPDLLAPGVDIVSLDYRNPRGYAVESGTSMATPCVAGAAACLYSMRPSLTPALIKRILLQSTIPLHMEPYNAQGRGVLNYETFFAL
ncbi:S8 family peptidase [Bacilliculturomica massiliensis]|uniref:S8 family peptidase n=1 Tax=Bacilliculturomica massiliensis TaxID=1917867 RepID=UPI0010323976|nr:S8 family peptidase [Bacilliculturomica massiliensis]